MQTQAPAALAGGAQLVREAHDAWVHRDRARLAQLRDQALAWRLPLAPWVDYWELAARLGVASVDEV
ncbi:MAG TPA: hypothetical protein VH328_11270, partial [Burkholderiaceae bacterium]|nr:hypothetical protein [Burkholderiaceae bacterium]